MVHKGHDFPENVERELQGWESGLKWVQTPERRTTRAWNGYKEGGEEERGKLVFSMLFEGEYGLVWIGKIEALLMGASIIGGG